MKRAQILSFLLWAACSFFAIAGCDRLPDVSSDRAVTPAVQLTVSAAASLKDAMEEIKSLSIDKNPDIGITYNFASSGSLQQQIEQGAPVDIFISAAAKQMNSLQEKGLLLDETRQDLLANQMVLIVSQGNTQVANFKDLSGDKIKTIALGEPESVPAGKYAKEVLTSLNIFEDVKGKAVYGKDVRQVLNYVATENVEAGIVYRTDAIASDTVKIVETASENSHSPVVYPIAVLKDSTQPDAAKEVVELMGTPEAKTIFERYGFQRATAGGSNAN